MKSLKAFLTSFIFAFRGIGAAFALGRNFKVQCVIAVVVIAVGFSLDLQSEEWLAVVLCIAGVLGAECANTAIEATVDLVTTELNPLAARAKDCAAGAVVIWALGSIVVGAVIFLPKILALLG